MAASSKSVPLMPLLLCLLLAVVPTRAQDEDDQWFWIMADIKNSTAACPGRCLAVNDTGSVDYKDKPVVFVACKSDDSSVSGSSTTSNNNQRWIRSSDSKPNTTIQFNATAATGVQGNTIELLCLQADPANSNLTLASCTGHHNQQWIIANNTIASLAHDPPHYLAMSYHLAGFLNASDGPLGWRQATILPSSRPPNNSLTMTFSMVDGTQELTSPYPIRSTEPNQTHNFITNPKFEQTSYDFPNETATLTVNPSDPFSLCDWQVMKGSATLAPNPERNLNRALSNQTLLLKDAVVRQNIATSPGAYYTLILKVAIAPRPNPSTTDTSTDCYGNDTLSVNPYPSTNVHLDVEVNNRSWTTQHVSFQAGGNILQLAFQGCASCGCYLDDLNLMQVIDSAPFPPPPFRPTPPNVPGPVPPKPNTQPPDRNGQDEASESHRLPNGTVVGMVVGTAALFLVIGAACFWVVVGHKKEMRKESEVGMGRPREWSIQTTSAAQSQPGARGNSSTTVPIHHSASATSGGGGGVAVISASSRTPTITTTTTTSSSPSLSSSNPLSERGA
ncbi:hypothetical protein SUGI_0822920 [Cryptomeria japonica]|nr:hypothetical protein SUGI_0822920 [Cryptomeria japonica]